MTPLIDVVFLLLIFFVCAAIGHTKEAKVETSLGPGVSKVPSPEELPPFQTQLWVKLEIDQKTEDVSIDINGQTYTNVDEVIAVLKALGEAAPENPVILDVGPGVLYGNVLRIHDSCRLAGFESINFAADP